uniref:AN1-type zinc finger protein 4 isoform X1 n=2 Tax=Gasterosteus aculeatus aculeatus TaxID=481459 RepID=UPI001A97E408|nr:AN1-type zinc finger protein 4 isoform X1 [Gasterosteus aculeatus aculeatus]XP_040035084.1 AN1-type zinc finger protein 4 isoform X1 [Gasterosteus aculeatus aculeatus]
MTDRKKPPFCNDDSAGALHHKLPFYDTMELFIETLTGTCFELRVLPFEAVISVKAKIQRLEGIPVAQQHLIWNNLELEDENCLHDYGIAEGCTLKLVLAMRGGPINTRRVTIDDPIKEVTDLMEGTKEEGWEKSLANKQVTFVVYRENDQLNFFRVVDRGDGTLTPLSESMSGGSVCNVYAEEEEEEEDGESSAATQQSLENSITMNKMKLLKAKMEDMNLSKKPKKSAKVKPRPSVNPHPCVGSLGATSSTRHHHRLFRSLSQMNQPWPSNAQLPPIADHESVDPFSLSAAATSAHFSASRRAPPSLPSPSCYMLREEEPWETCPSFAKIRPPPKVSRLDIGCTRLMRDCVYPQLPPLCIRGPPEASFDPAEPAGEADGPSLLEEAAGLMAPVQPGTPFGELLDPLSLDVSAQPESRSLGVGAQQQFPISASPLGTWTLGTSDALTSDGSHLGTPFYMRSPSPPTSTGPLPLAFDSTLSCLQPDLQAQVKPGGASNHPPATASTHPLGTRGVKVESPGKRPGLISKREARGIAQMANQAWKEPVGSLKHSDLLASHSTRAADGDHSRDGLGEVLGLTPASPPYGASGPGSLSSRLPSIPTNRLLQHNLIRQMSPLQRAAASYTATAPLSSAGGVMTSFGRIGAPTYHLPPVKAPTGSKKKSSKHCFLCGKKTGLATSYECRCGHNFCCSHRYAETHDCTFDYKGAGRRLLQETNPLISAPKLPKI